MKFPLKTSRATVAVLALLYVASLPARCQQTPAAPNANRNALSAQPVLRLADGHPDLNGFWASGSGPDTPVGSSFGPPRDPNIKRGDWAGAKAQAADPNQPPYKPELIAKVKELARTESKSDPAFFCKPGGVPRIGPPHAIIQAPGMPILFLYQVISGNTFRLVPTDGRPHNPEADGSYYGDSIGHWEGDTLVVDTTEFNDDTWLGLYGWFHSAALHVTERISRQGDTLHYQATVEDPEIFTRPWTMNPWISKSTKESLVENAPCIESDIGHITSFDEKTKIQ